MSDDDWSALDTSVLSGSGSDDSPLTSSDGGINGVTLAFTILAAIVASVMEGIASVIRAFYTAFIIEPAQGVADWYANYVEAYLGVPAAAFEAVSAEAAAFTTQFGAFGFLVGTVIVLATLFVVARGGRYV